MRKIVSDEMVAAAVEHCRREGKNPSRGRVMGLLALQEFGGCAGDPARVGSMIREYLTAKGGEEVALAPAGEVPGQPLPPQIEAVLAQTAERMSESMCSLADAVASELGSIRDELRASYDHSVEQLRRDADRVVASAQTDEQDALNVLSDALAQTAALEERIEVLMAEQSGALAVAADRGEQLLRIEAELERVRTEAAAASNRLVTERDDARREAQNASRTAREREGVITDLESKLATLQADLDRLRQQSGISQALADERAARITQLESLLVDALRDVREHAVAPMNATEATTSAQDKASTGPEVVEPSEGNQRPSNKGDSKHTKSAKPGTKNPPDTTGTAQDSSGLTP